MENCPDDNTPSLDRVEDAMAPGSSNPEASHLAPQLLPCLVRIDGNRVDRPADGFLNGSRQGFELLPG
jgi:hypothetical protein